MCQEIIGEIMIVIKDSVLFMCPNIIGDNDFDYGYSISARFS